MQKIKRLPLIDGQKRACVSRYGAWGDALWVTPVLRALKADGYHVTLNCTERCYDILKTDPHIDEVWLMKTNEIPNEELTKWWKETLAPQFDRFINLNGSFEEALLLTPWQEEYNWPHIQRHEKCNVNYMDHTMRTAGYPDKKGEIPELHFKKSEEEWAEKFLTERKGFTMLWCLSGSSFHKIYPYAQNVISAVLEGIPDSHVILVGEPGCAGLIEKHERVTDLCNVVGIRKSYVLTKYVDIVVGPETSVLAASSCFDTPKVVFLSHSSEENLTKYWKNAFPVYEPKVSCYPCHKLHYTRNSCPTDDELRLPSCVVSLNPERVCTAIQTVYLKRQMNLVEK